MEEEKKVMLQNYFQDFISSIEFNAEFDFEKTIKILPNFRTSLIRIIKHSEEIDNLLVKQKEFVVGIPFGYHLSDFKKFEDGKAYRVIIWKILKDAPKKIDLLLKISQEGEYILAGLEGLRLVETFAKNEIPFDVAILSFSKKEREDIKTFCHYKNSGAIEYRPIFKYGTMISKKNLLISFHPIN